MSNEKETVSMEDWLQDLEEQDVTERTCSIDDEECESCGS